MHLDPETIVATATAPGRAGIGIVRVSGPLARFIATSLFRLVRPLAPGRACFGHLLDDEGGVLDEAIVTFFAAPHSYTGEDVAEMSVHGAPVLLDYLLRACIGRGARLAHAGEFTQRAFLNGRLDLTQAEAVADLVNSKTIAQAQLAAAQLGGSLSQAVAPLKLQLIDLIAALEAGVDFAEDDLDLVSDSQVAAQLTAIHSALSALEASSRHGQIVREGFRLALIGRPNAGKSSLFNRLLRRERAIVTAMPGTTRDPITEHLAIGGIPVQLTDTAGLRELTEVPQAEAEAEGIRRSYTSMAESEFVLLVIDATTLLAQGRLDAVMAQTLASIKSRPHLVALNKVDLVDRSLLAGTVDMTALPVSARTGEGIAELTEAILGAVRGAVPQGDSAQITNLRQQREVAQALVAVTNALRCAQQKMPHEFLLLDLYTCLAALDSLTGATAQDEILDRIFSSFCIGK